MALRFYFDDDSAQTALLRALSAAGLDAIGPQSVEMRGRPDDEHLAFATGEGRVLCSSNMGDFLRLHRDLVSARREHGGIVLIAQQRYSVGDLLRRLRRLDADLTPELMRSHVEFLSRWG
ncbi:MAG: DUF5615 family PIN-like protein [Chloroflexi bacterium]|nr:DUF5615 family PIN-like protein [Chloroflexota bacterium]